MKILEEIKNFKEKPDFGQVGNDILYNMCSRYQHHNKESEIIAKIWLIGRSYAASIERGKKEKMILKDKVSDDFFKEVACIFIKEKFDDEVLFKVSDNKLLTEKEIPIILKTHKKVMEFIHNKITGDDKRSFVSKYLHFHFKNLFFIYDSRVAGIIKEIFEEIGHTQKDVRRLQDKLEEHDDIYANFFIKCFYFWKFCEENIPLSVREIDNFLIQRANEKVRNKKINR